jgi:glyoxylase-like metal-dependent hydrolase (beta-lactamase superfamily II)
MPTEPKLPFHRIVVPTPYAVGPANVYVITADPVTLIDCGPNTPATENALFLGLAELGLVPQQVARVVVTHGHPDHFGLVPRFQELAGARILVGELDIPKVAQDRSLMMATGALLLQQGMPAEELVRIGEGGRKLGGRPPPVVGAEPLHEADTLPFDGFELEVLHLPGHTAGHICLFHRQSGVLFSGDTLILHITPNPLLEPDPEDPSERRRSLIEYVRSLERLAALPLSTVHPGHGEPIHDPHGLIEAMRAHHRERADDLAGRLSERAKTGWQLALELFPNVGGFDNFLAVSEVVAHMDLLVEDGRARAITRDGVTGYVAA